MYSKLKNANMSKDNIIYAISPSAPITGEAVSLSMLAEKKLADIGISIKYSKHFFKKINHLSGSTSERVSDLHEAFKDTNSKIILASQGGNNSNDLLDSLDFGLVKKYYKPFFGMSDVTVLLNAIYNETGHITYHGIDTIWGIGRNGDKYTLDQLNDFLTDKYLPFHNPLDQTKWRMINAGKGAGFLLGGCLSSFILLLGTKYDPLNSSKEYILFFEDINETPDRISAYFRQICLHKNIGKCRGIILGNFFQCTNDAYQGSIEELALVCFGNLNIPIIKIPEIGHAVENMIMPIGQSVEISSNAEATKLYAL